MVNKNSIDNCIWKIQRVLMTKYGCTAADREIAPLIWYINTGRASTPFLKKLIDAKPFMIARKLHMGGSDAEIMFCRRIIDRHSNGVPFLWKIWMVWKTSKS